MKIRKNIMLAFGLSFSGLLLSLTQSFALETTNLESGSNDANVVVLTEITSNALPAAATDVVITNTTAAVEHWDNSQPIVLFGQDAELKSGDSAETVVVIGGSAVIHGRVRQEVVVIGGDAEVDGNVGQAVVALGGNVHLKSGASVGQDTVSVLGSVSVDPMVRVKGNAVAIGGKLNLADGALVKGNKVNVSLPRPLGNVDWLRDWIRYCVFELRPLAFQVGFVWWIAGFFLLIYLFIVAVFARPVQKSVEDLDHRPATIFLFGLLAKVLVPFIYLILIATGIGAIVVPIIGVTLFLFSIYGKVVVLQWLGFKIGRFGSGVQKPLMAFLLGAGVLTLLYLIPVVGFLAFMIFGIWGLGSGIVTVLGCVRRETPQPPEPPAAATPMSGAASPNPSQAPPIIENDNNAPTEAAAPASEAAGGATTPPPTASQTQPAASFPTVSMEAATYPKANLWERLLAALLDIILIGLVSGFTNLQRYSLFIALCYFTFMWMWRGTSIGGLLFKLKVMRTDGRPLTFMVCLVRGLAAAFSVIILFLGFLWIAWDKDKQGWHDKIAGTVVIRLPHSPPLILA